MKVFIKWKLFFERVMPILVQTTHFNTLLMLEKRLKTVITDEVTGGTLYFSNLRLKILPWEIVKHGRFLHIESAVASHINDLSDNDFQNE